METSECIRCKSKRIIKICGHTCDCFYMHYHGEEYNAYVPQDIGIGDGGDDIEFSYCLDCGQIQNKFPINENVVTEIYKIYNEEE